MINETPNLRKPTILIIDDDEIFVELLSDELNPYFVVEWARDSRTALRAIERQTPDCIFLDQNLPDLLGVQLIDEIRKLGCATPVVMLTASQDVRVAAGAMRAGAVDFVVKDINEAFYEDLVPTAIRAVEKWNNEKELDYLRDQQQEQNSRTLQLNNELVQKNRELEQAYEDIAAAGQQLQKKNQRLSELYDTAHRFVDNVSHEMRTPLTVIKEFLAIVMDGLAGPINDQQGEYLQIAIAKTNDLAQMVEDMLDISKIEAGLLRVDRQCCQVNDIVCSIHQILEQKSRSYHLELNFEAPADLPPVYCDQEKVGRILINLVVNAMKFSPEGSQVRVCFQLADTNDEVLVKVCDNGPGISPEHLEVIFDRFRQVGEGTRTSTKGFGLGLSIVRELANLNLSDVRVQSTVGQGSTFSFSLPVYNPLKIIDRFLQRHHTYAHHGQNLTILRGWCEQPSPEISQHIRSFVVHHSSPYDLCLEQPQQGMVLILTLVNDPQSYLQRLLLHNREELRLSPGSTVNLNFEILKTWPLESNRQRLIQEIQTWVPDTTMEQADVLSTHLYRG
ncbi:MAG: Adaptive-response sensory-kinase SasA [Phycisphaerae bacterium]|nr:Adaptive-response sensory-kinase SasA [Phycisphaerae bacterium]